MIRREHLEVYDLVLTTRAPLHIGSGRSYMKKQYLFNAAKGEVSFLDENAFVELIAKRGLADAYESFMLGRDSDLWRFLTKDCRLTSQEVRSVVRWSVGTGNVLDAQHSLKEIHCFTRAADGSAYIPGSSVKGALRTALLAQRFVQQGPARDIERTRRGDPQIPEEKVFRQLRCSKDRDGAPRRDAVNSILRGVSVSDSAPIPDSAMTLAGKVDALTGGQTNAVNLCRECVRPGVPVRFKLTLDQSILQGRITAQSIQEAICAFDAFYEKNYLPRFARPKDQMAVNYTNCLLLGGGAGFFSKSLLYPYLGWQRGLRETADLLQRNFSKHRHGDDDVDRGVSPHTLKYASYQGKLYPYGLCEVTIT